MFLRDSTGILFVGAFALGLLVVSRQSNYTGDLFSFVFGNVLAVTWGDVWLTLGIGALVVVIATVAIAQAAQQVASNRGKYGPGDEGDLGLGQRQSNARVGPYEILSDTMGVDFGPYLQRVLHDVKQNWYAIIPESALPPLLKRGKVSIEFSILKNGQAVTMAYIAGSGDVALDRAAYGGITASNPFPPLPREYAGQALRLRFTFYYNPDPREAALQ